jgi:tRNA(Ser,Leu) C12 N-acetylase TAN1
VDDWNVLATSVEGARPVLMSGLRRLGVFRGAGYRNVAIGRVEDVAAFLAAWRDAMAGDTMLAAAVGRVLPIACTFRLDAADPTASLLAAVEALAPEIDGRSFYVRVARRGLRDVLDSSEAERTLGTALWRRIEASGRTPRVVFDDPEVVIAAETLGDRGGIGLLDRALRAAYPFVRVS